MSRKRDRPEETVARLREAVVLLSQGAKVANEANVQMLCRMSSFLQSRKAKRFACLVDGMGDQ